jgi:hypothetical protein
MSSVKYAANAMFLSALETFIRGRDNPIYLIHGAWVNEELIGKYNDAYAIDAQIDNNFSRTRRRIVDAIHGMRHPAAIGLCGRENIPPMSRSKYRMIWH